MTNHDRIKQADEQRQMRDEYHAMEERVAKLEDALRECEVEIDKYIDADYPPHIPIYRNKNEMYKAQNPARLALEDRDE